MRGRVAFTAFALTAALAGCSGSGGDTGPVMPDTVGKKLDVALSAIEKAGFDKDVDIKGGGTFGVVVKSNWEVCDQSPAAGKPIGAKVEVTVERSCADTTTTAPTTTAPAAPTEPATTSPSLATETLTAANNPDLAAILVTRRECGDEVANFATTYLGRTIEFDGNAANIGPEGTGPGRIRVLVYSGDYSATSGAQFQFRDVTPADLNLTGPGAEAGVNQGDNLRVVARVGEFNRAGCLLYLEPVAVQKR